MLPGRSFEGRIDYIYPELKAETRTVKARVSLRNPGMLLMPGMFAEVEVFANERRTLTVPSEAVIQTGTRSVVIVQEGERFRPAEVKHGMEHDGRTEILAGLKAGETVVVSGQFLIDSEASLRGALARLEGGGHPGKGKVTDVLAEKGRVELDHGPIPSLKWPGMTMEFVVEDKAALANLKKGDSVEFEVRGEPTKDGDYVIEKIRKGAS
jgi:Cu(I)/Ag(I) efflux system membrane fusion protein